jgi:hypothetical protein
MSQSAAHALQESPLAPVSMPLAVPATRVVQAPAQIQAFPRVNALMHRGVYKIALGCWAGFLAVFWATFWVSANALFMVVIGTFYALMFFGVPIIMSRMAPTRPRPGSLGGFLRGRFATIDGPISGSDALLQVILVPVALGLGGTAIGFIIHAARAAY